MQYKMTGQDGHDMTAEIDSFAKIIGLERACPGRYSLILVLGLFGGYKSGHQGPEKIIHEIEALEGAAKPSILKAPIQFEHPPLKGLWHKHYLQDGLSSMATNIQKGLNKFGMPLMSEWVREAKESGEERLFSAEHVAPLVNDIVSGNLQRLASEQAVTGEWLIYAQHQGKNYYLCLGTHDKQSHENLRRQIDAVCCLEFPFLTAFLTNA